MLREARRELRVAKQIVAAGMSQRNKRLHGYTSRRKRPVGPAVDGNEEPKTLTVC